MRSRLRAALLLLLLGATLLEALSWTNAPLSEAVHRSYPNVGLDREGRVVYYEREKETGADGQRRLVYVLDASRNSAEILDLGPAKATSDLVLTGDRFYFSALDFDNPRFLLEVHKGGGAGKPYSALLREPPDPLEYLANNSLGFIESQRRGINAPAGTGNDLGMIVFTWDGTRPRTAPIDWGVENSRLVCREKATGKIVAGLGPDGYVRGEGAERGERFGHIENGPLNVDPYAKDSFEWLLLDYQGRRVHVISVPKEQSEARSVPADSLEPVTLTIDTRPLHPLPAGEEVGEKGPFLRIFDRSVLAFLADGSVVAEVELDPGERVFTATGGLLVRSEGFAGLVYPPPQKKFEGVGIETSFLPVRLDTEHRRLRLLRPGQPAIVREVTLTPTRPSEVLLANLAASLSLLRPPASAVSPLPMERWWWRDPRLAGGSYPGWLIASIALAALLAWRARRAARERCATAAHVRFWTAAVLLLGPVGFLWMKLVLPRVPVEPIGGSHRAVDLDASPATDAPWPLPQPQGIEVFQ